MSQEFSPQQNTTELWDAALIAIQATKEGQQPRLLGQDITTIPPNSRTPEQIIFQYNYDGPWRDVSRTLAFTAIGPVSYEYADYHREEIGDGAEIDESYGPDAPETLDWLSDLAQSLRQAKRKEEA